jgi:hypothetical protein
LFIRREREEIRGKIFVAEVASKRNEKSAGKETEGDKGTKGIKGRRIRRKRTDFVEGRKKELKEWTMRMAGKRDEETILEEYGECIERN